MVREARITSSRSKLILICKYLAMKFDDLVEVFTDKLVAKIPSTCSGTVKEVLFNVDDICLVGHSLLSIELENEEVSSS
jgi:pyruvate/2-oxoglutarate dehydrogenase complex dihydrolipoamide acyltransferase (E2) component